MARSRADSRKRCAGSISHSLEARKLRHLDDDAELYALGLTDLDDTAAIEAHLAGCDVDRARVVRAEATAAALAATLPAMHAAAPSRAPWLGLATAAAVVLAVTTAFEGVATNQAAQRLAMTDTALIAVASSHFGHVTLDAQPGVTAKVLYSRDGTWCFIVAEGVGPGAHVQLHHGSATRDLGTLGSGSPATLFVRNPGRADAVAIVVDGRDVAHGVPSYQ